MGCCPSSSTLSMPSNLEQQFRAAMKTKYDRVSGSDDEENDNSHDTDVKTDLEPLKPKPKLVAMDLGLGLGTMSQISNWCKDRSQINLSPQHLMNMLCMCPPLTESEVVHVLSRKYKFERFWPFPLQQIDTNIIHLGQILYACGVFQGLDFVLHVEAGDDYVISLADPVVLPEDTKKDLLHRRVFFAVKDNHFPLLGEAELRMGENKSQVLFVKICDLVQLVSPSPRKDETILEKTLGAIKSIYRLYTPPAAPMQMEVTMAGSSQRNQGLYSLLARAICWRCLAPQSRSLVRCFPDGKQPDNVIHKMMSEQKTMGQVKLNLDFLLNFAAVACGPWVTDVRSSFLKSDKTLTVERQEQYARIASQKDKSELSELHDLIHLMCLVAWRLQFQHGIDVLTGPVKKKSRMERAVYLCIDKSVKLSNPLFLDAAMKEEEHFRSGAKTIWKYALGVFRPNNVEAQVESGNEVVKRMWRFYSWTYQCWL